MTAICGLNPAGRFQNPKLAFRRARGYTPPMQKRMKSAHPRTPGGRNFVPPGNQAGGHGNSKYMPSKQSKPASPAKPKKEDQ